MKLNPAVGLLLALAVSVSGQSSAGRLEGCPDPNLLAKALKLVSESDWNEMSFARLASDWPAKLRGAECESDACTEVIHEGRIIEGTIECEEVFNLDIHRGSNGSPKEELHSVVLHYTGNTKEETILAAKIFARAAGVAEKDASTIGTSPVQYFNWKDDHPMPISYDAELQLIPVGARWKIFLVFVKSRNPA
jgi:hypothetical protein